MRKTTKIWILGCILALATVAGCDDGKKSGNNANVNNQNNGDCVIEGTYTIDATEVLEGACDLAIADPGLKIRRVGSAVLLKFDNTSWTTSGFASCGFDGAGPDYWISNGVQRTRAIEVSVDGDVLVAEMTDQLDGADSYGHTCDVRWRIRATRTGPAPTGVGVGESGCGPVGCSASVCAFGGEFDCADAVCLLDATGGWLETYCTRPCADAGDCPEDFECVQAQETWDGAAPGRYCKRWRAVCGNGALEEGEVCDDGNTDDGDGCSADCQHTEACGNERFESGEACDAGASGEWLTCSETCEIELPEPARMPLPLGASDPLVAAVGTRAFLVVGYDPQYLSGSYEPLVVTARTVDGGQTWTSGVIPSSDWANVPPKAIAVHGSRVVVGFSWATGLRLAESDDGGVTWSPSAAVAVPEGQSEDEYGTATFKMVFSPDGALWVALAKPGALVVLRRASPGQPFLKLGELALPDPPGATSCRLYFTPYRFETSNGAGVQLHRTADGARLVAGASCWGGSGYDHSLWTARFDAAGPVGAPVDLRAASGLTVADAIVLGADWRSSPVACLSGGMQTVGEARCAEVDEGTLTWTFTGVPAVPASYDAGGPDAVFSDGPGRWWLVQDVSAGGGSVRIHVTDDAGANWSFFDVPSAGAYGRTLARVSATAAILFEVDGNNEASLVRLDLAAGSSGPRVFLFGEARRNDGSGLPWTFSCDHDGAADALLAFSLPDTLRQWIHVARPLE